MPVPTYHHRRRPRHSRLRPAAGAAAARACYVLAHGAGAGMAHPFMAAVAAGSRSAASRRLRYQFPYMEHGGKRPDPPKLAHAAVRAAVAAAARLRRAAAVRRRQVVRRPHDVAGAGARRRCRRARPRLPRLSAASRPASRRASAREHLSDVRVPMLFLQGTRDALATRPCWAGDGTRRARHAAAPRRCRPFLPRAGPQRPQRCRVMREMLDALAGLGDFVTAR